MKESIWGQGVNIEEPVQQGGVQIFKLQGDRDAQVDAAAISPDAAACADGVGETKGGGRAADIAVTGWVRSKVSDPAFKVLADISARITALEEGDACATFVGARKTREQGSTIHLEMLSVGDSQGFFVDPKTRKILYCSPTVNALSVDVQEVTATNHPAANTLNKIFASIEPRLSIENGGQIPSESVEKWKYVHDIALAYAHCIPEQLGGSVENATRWSADLPSQTEAWLFTDGVTRVMPVYEMQELIQEHGTEAAFPMIVKLIKERKENPMEKKILLGRTPEGHRILGPIATLTLRKNKPDKLVTDPGDNTTLVRKTTWSTAQTQHPRSRYTGIQAVLSYLQGQFRGHRG